MARKLTPKALQRRLRACEREYDRIKERVHDVGFICEGSLVERWTSCGKPNCRCATDPDHRHGPYYQLSWKEAGKTVSRRLPPEHARLYEEWITNRRQLNALIQQMRAVSNEAGQYLLDDAATSTLHRPRPGSRRSRTS